MKRKCSVLMLGVFLSLSFFLSFGFVSAVDICEEEMISYWKLDETSGTTFFDYVDSNDASCSGVNCPAFATGVVNGALDFDGVNDRLVVPDDSSLDWSNGQSFSIELWANFTNCDSRNKVMIGRDDRPKPGIHWWLGCRIADKKPTFFLFSDSFPPDDGTFVQGTTVINDGNWHHLVVVRNALTNIVDLYVDGVKEGTATHTFVGDFGAPSTLGIGYQTASGTPDFFYDGLLDEIALYGRILSASEILTHYNNGVGENYCRNPVCGDGEIEGDEECDDGNDIDGDGCSNSCKISRTIRELKEIPIQTCTGEGELFLYSGDPFQPIDTSFVTQRDRLLIFMRDGFALGVEVDGSSVTPTLLFSSSFLDVQVFFVDTTPGDLIEISGSHADGARRIQGYITQNRATPVYDISTLEIIYDDEQDNVLFLEPGTYSYVFFDKYSPNRPGEGPDNRLLSAILTGPGGEVFNRPYTQPYPSPTQGAVVDDYTISAAGIYTLHVDTEDSVYWPLAECPMRKECGDGRVDLGEQCDDGNNIDGDGCDSDCRFEGRTIPIMDKKLFILLVLALMGLGVYSYKRQR